MGTDGGEDPASQGLADRLEGLGAGQFPAVATAALFGLAGQGEIRYLEVAIGEAFAAVPRESEDELLTSLIRMGNSVAVACERVRRARGMKPIHMKCPTCDPRHLPGSRYRKQGT